MSGSQGAGSLDPSAGLLRRTAPFPRRQPQHEQTPVRTPGDHHPSWEQPWCRVPTRGPLGQAGPAAGWDLRDRAWLQNEENPLARAGHRRTSRKEQRRTPRSEEDGAGLRHVHGQDRPELLFCCRKPVQKNGRNHRLNPCQTPLTPSPVLLPPPPKEN